MSAEASQPSSEHDRVVGLLVGLALDDLECGNLDVETALRFVAHRAWLAGLREAQNTSDGGVAQPGADAHPQARRSDNQR
jgi:hypothetical protein